MPPHLVPKPDRYVKPSEVYRLLLDDLQRYRYSGLVPLVVVHRQASRGRRPTTVMQEPIVEAAAHLVAALVHLRRAVTDQTPGARLIYQAVLAAAGGLARHHPETVLDADAVAIPKQRRGEQS